jgi:hypothetical protein
VKLTRSGWCGFWDGFPLTFFALSRSAFWARQVSTSARRFSRSAGVNEGQSTASWPCWWQWKHPRSFPLDGGGSPVVAFADRAVSFFGVVTTGVTFWRSTRPLSCWYGITFFYPCHDWTSESQSLGSFSRSMRDRPMSPWTVPVACSYRSSRTSSFATKMPGSSPMLSLKALISFNRRTRSTASAVP